KLKSVCKKKQEYENKFKAANQQLGHIESTLQQQLTDTQDQCSRASEQLKHTIESTDKFRIETRDLIQYGIIVGKAMKSIMEAIAMLQKDYDILEFKLKNINDLSDHLLNEAESYAQHVLVEEEDSEIELQNRQKHLNQSNVALETSLYENLMLAKEYQTLQTCYLDEKDKLMCDYEKRVNMEATLRDYLQISALQSRMHRALGEFFKQRGLYSQAGLAKFQAASQENAQKILAVQEEMSKTIQHVSAFLSSLADGSPSEDSKANNQSISDAETKDRKSHTVQITV
ncbi:hypothetical protein FKM82_006170, partial [Ascaphus truei]